MFIDIHTHQCVYIQYSFSSSRTYQRPSIAATTTFLHFSSSIYIYSLSYLNIVVRDVSSPVSAWSRFLLSPLIPSVHARLILPFDVNPNNINMNSSIFPYFHLFRFFFGSNIFFSIFISKTQNLLPSVLSTANASLVLWVAYQVFVRY